MFEDFLRTIVFVLPACLIAIIVHEASHGLTSYMLGDPTPKEEGRLSLNPMRHLDFLGTLSLLIFHFGWAKPVNVRPEYYKNKKLGMFLVALAGPLANFIVAFIGVFFLGIVIKTSNGEYSRVTEYLYNLFLYIFIINIGLGVFNLIPIPPLDGSKILGVILPSETYFKIMRYELYLSFFLVLLLCLGILDRPLEIITSNIFDFYYFIIRMIFKI